MILWPIFFVAASQQDPQYKPRDFKKAVKKTIGGIRIGDSRASAARDGFGEGKVGPPIEKPHWAHQGEQVRHCFRTLLLAHRQLDTDS